MIPAMLIGAGAGLVVGAVVRKRAREAIAQELLLGSRRLSSAVNDGRAALLSEAPPQIRAGVDNAISSGLSRAGLTEMQLRILIGNISRLRRLL
jgi:hypothetical protein